MGQEAATFPVERLRPAINREGIIDVEWGVVGEHLNFDLTLGLGYAHNPLRLYRQTPTGLTRAGSLVQHRLSADVIGTLALFGWVDVAVHVPVALYQGRGPPTLEAAPAALDAVGIGDLGLIPKVQLLNAADHFIDLAVLATVTFPTGYPSQGYFGEKTVTFVPEVIISRRLPGLRLAGNLGFRLRETTRQLGMRVGSEFTYRLGAGHRLDDYTEIPLEISASLSGSIAASDPGQSFNRNPLEILLAAAYDIGDLWQVYLGVGAGLIAGFATPDARVFAGVRFSPRSGDRDGDGIPDTRDICVTTPEDLDSFEDEDGCPDRDNDQDGIPDELDGAPFEPEDKDGFEDGDGIPEGDNDLDGIDDANDLCPNEAEDWDGQMDEDGCPDVDRDGDGIIDEFDACPEDPEDIDGFADADGCPDPDNDNDGIADGDDACPFQAEIINGYQDEDGCPDVEPEVKANLKGTELEIYGKVYFDTGKSVIKPRSFDLLRQVANILKTNPQILKLAIEGHTDSQGSAEGNMILSQDRADSVRRFLIQEGIDGKRLVAQGFGQTKPIASNATERGRAQNRRVAFTILEVAEGASSQSIPTQESPR